MWECIGHKDNLNSESQNNLLLTKSHYENYFLLKLLKIEIILFRTFSLTWFQVFYVLPYMDRAFLLK
jgi:hypothetical protein